MIFTTDASLLQPCSNPDVTGCRGSKRHEGPLVSSWLGELVIVIYHILPVKDNTGLQLAIHAPQGTLRFHRRPALCARERPIATARFGHPNTSNALATTCKGAAGHLPSKSQDTCFTNANKWANHH